MMNRKQFDLWHRICALVALAVSSVTYLLTIEPSASYWDCGEFIASSYKLEVGHPPGNPVFQLFARIFTIFGDNMHAAVLVNALSAICSGLTIFFLYLTIVFLVKRLIVKKEQDAYSPAQAVAIFGSGLVGALAYCFSDTFWFSAVEGEVYAMSSLFTAMVFWAMTHWYDHADEPHANRWIVLIAFLMGLSIGVHLLNLLAIPAIVFLYYYRQREDRPFSFWELVKIFAVGVVILGLLNFLFIPYLPKLAAYVDLLFVNVFGLPYNSGAAFFMVAVFVLCFWGLSATYKRRKVFWNTALLCLTTILIGFSLFSIDIIRSCAKTPTNEYQPDNAFTLVRYLSREQYGSAPLVYGQYFDAPYDLETVDYWAPLDGKYKKVEGPLSPKYKATGKMLFPRMWSAADPKYISFYEAYTQGKGQFVRDAEHRKPTMGANLAYFFDYQLNWMYWRYFLWNFVGRQNEIHSPTPGNLFYGNWESGIDALDELRLGDQYDAPDALRNNKGKNHYFFLPLLLGLLGLFYQFARDKRGCWLTFLMFFMTGIAIVLYLNQPPGQVRERDYAYAGSFYFFCVWIGLGVAAIYDAVDGWRHGKGRMVTAAGATLACLCVPALMAAQNWDDHDRSNRATAVEMAGNYLRSVGENGILVTHGDNDTFPLWYAQEVEGIRTDVRICNTSLLGTDWHIDQMTWAVNQSAPLRLSVPHEQYLYGNNEYIPIHDVRNQVMSISDVMRIFRHPDARVALTSGRRVDYIPSQRISVPVNKENVIKYGILSADFEPYIPDEIILTIPSDKTYLTKPELFFLDLLDNYQWDRPLHFLSMGGDINIGIKEYLMFEGYSYKFVPVKTGVSTIDAGLIDPVELDRLFTKEFRFDAVARDDYFIDYQNLYTNLGTMSLRGLFYVTANAFIELGENEMALALMDRGVEVMQHYPLESICLGFSANDYMVAGIIDNYYKLGQPDKARALAKPFGEELMKSAVFFLSYYDVAQREFDDCASYLYYLADVMAKGGDKEASDDFRNRFSAMLSMEKAVADD